MHKNIILDVGEHHVVQVVNRDGKVVISIGLGGDVGVSYGQDLLDEVERLKTALVTMTERALTAENAVVTSEKDSRRRVDAWYKGLIDERDNLMETNKVLAGRVICLESERNAVISELKAAHVDIAHLRELLHSARLPLLNDGCNGLVEDIDNALAKAATVLTI